MLSKLAEFLTENEDKLVKDVKEQLLAQMTSILRAPKEQVNLFDESGQLVARRCYYFKRWMPLVGPQAVAFGVKRGDKTGLNEMCSRGCTLWYNQNRQAKKAKADLVDKLALGKIKQSDLAALLVAIEAARKKIEPTTLGFETLEECQAYLDALKVSK